MCVWKCINDEHGQKNVPLPLLLLDLCNIQANERCEWSLAGQRWGSADGGT